MLFAALWSWVPCKLVVFGVRMCFCFKRNTMQISAMLSLGGTYYIVLCNKQKKKQQKETNQSVFTLFPKSCSGTIVLYVDLVVTTQTPRKQDHIQREVSHTSDHTNISICHSFSFFHVFLLLNQQSTINYMHYSTVFQAALIKLH